MDWKTGLTNMFLVGRQKGFFKLIFIWIPQTFLVSALVFFTGMHEDMVWLFMIFLVIPLNFYIFSVYLHKRFVQGDEWAEEEYNRNQLDRPSESSGDWFGSLIGILLLIAVCIFISLGLI